MTSSLLAACLAVLLAAGPSRAAGITNGPQAGVSLRSEMAWSTARACAAGCLAYNGDFPCQVRGFHDLGVELGCGGCGQINGCYCKAELGSSATSYISACVKYKCPAVANWDVDAAAMVDLYNAYCTTANVAPATTPLAQPTGAGNNPTNTGTSPGQTANAGAASQTAPPGSTPTGAAATEKSGLSQSDIVALAASLGVGIPSIAIAGTTLWLQLRRKKRAKAKEAAAMPSPSISHPHVTGMPGGQVGSPGPTYY